MTAKLWLRISSAISLVFGAGHSLGGLSHWSPMGGDAGHGGAAGALIALTGSRVWHSLAPSRLPG